MKRSQQTPWCLYLVVSLICSIMIYAQTVSQTSNDTVNVFEKEFQSAAAICIDPFGNIYIADAGANEVWKYDAKGNYKIKTGGSGWSETAFDHPADIATPNGLDVYVADYGNHRIQRFDRNLNLISTYQKRESDESLKKFGYPSGVALDRYGAMYILDGENSRVIKMRGNAIEAAFGGVDAGAGSLHSPLAIAITGDDIIFVRDEHSIFEYDMFGNFIREYSHDVLSGIHAISLLENTLVVLDSCNAFTFQNSFKDTLQIERTQSSAELLCQAVDAAVFKDSLYILTEKSVAVIPLLLEKKSHSR